MKTTLRWVLRHLAQRSTVAGLVLVSTLVLKISIDDHTQDALSEGLAGLASALLILIPEKPNVPPSGP